MLLCMTKRHRNRIIVGRDKQGRQCCRAAAHLLDRLLRRCLLGQVCPQISWSPGLPAHVHPSTACITHFLQPHTKKCSDKNVPRTPRRAHTTSQHLLVTSPQAVAHTLDPSKSLLAESFAEPDNIARLGRVAAPHSTACSAQSRPWAAAPQPAAPQLQLLRTPQPPPPPARPLGQHLPAGRRAASAQTLTPSESQTLLLRSCRPPSSDWRQILLLSLSMLV